MNQKKYGKLSEKAKTYLQVLCSNYRDSFNITAYFKCRQSYGGDNFRSEIEKNMSELRKYKFISDYYIDEDSNDGEKITFKVSATSSMHVEDMAEVAINSQSVYIS